MKKQQTGRAIIREWMGLPRDKRQTQEQTASFVARAMQPMTFPQAVAPRSG